MTSRRVSTPLRRLTLVILGVTALVAGDHCPLQAADKIRLSVTNFNMSFLPAGIAVKRGFFKEEGLETEVIRMNANVAIAALAGGGVDYTMIFFFKGGTFPGRR